MTQTITTTAAVFDPDAWLPNAEARAGQRCVLSAFRDLSGIAHLESLGLPHRDRLRACVALVRDAIASSECREELGVADGTAGCGATDLARAFLAAEADLLAAAIEAIEGGGAIDPQSQAGTRVWRQLCRIEAALELHAFTAADRRPAAPPAAAEPSRAAGKRPMTDAEIDELLHDLNWGVLSTACADGPYAVPVTYCRHADALLVAMSPGRKAGAIDGDPRVALTVAEVAGPDRWRSVVVRGEAHWITEPVARLKALRRIAQRKAGAGMGAISLKDLQRMVTARVVRIGITELTGRRSG